ncbi:MAG: hypothetical protein ACE5R7_03780, partial [Nitrosarchaeum sp.]
MKDLNLSASLKEKIYQIKLDSHNDVLKIISYFPLSEDEIQTIVTMNKLKSFTFHSVFSDHIS